MAESDTQRLRRYPSELRKRAVGLVAETAAERGDRHGAVTLVARQPGSPAARHRPRVGSPMGPPGRDRPR